MRLLFTNDWLRKRIAADPDCEPEAGDLYGETMTTQIHIVNSSDSNPGQHSRVTFSRPGQDDQVTLLAPGQSKGYWISGNTEGVGDKITVVEVFAPKPAA